MRKLTDAELKVLIRDAAMNRWASGDDDNWIDVRVQEEGWTEQEVADFLSYYNSQIQRAEAQIDKWLKGEGELI